MKKILFCFLGAILVLLLIYVLGSGFTKEGSAYIDDYVVSDDGSSMTVKIGVGSSVGCVRKLSIHQQEGGKLYLDCISAFGGINGSIGAKNEFVIPLKSDTRVIGLYRNNNAYEVILEKDNSGNWNRAK